VNLAESIHLTPTLRHLWPVESRRLGGLDLLRSVAVVLVVLCHYSMERRFPLPFNIFGWVGVDLFFVLSGYLIGGQLFNLHLKHSSIPFKTFYLRRCLRTLPNYFVVLALFVIIPGLSPLTSFKERLVPLWEYVTFTQNLFLHMPFFHLSWSLCVEEHFYLVLPLLISLCVKLRIRWIASAFLLVILSQILLRAGIIIYGLRVLHLVDQRDIIAYLTRIYYPTYCRLDGLTIGVALAAMRCYRPALWSRLMAQGNRLLFAGGVGLCLAALLISSKSYLLSGTVIFTLLGVSFGLMTASALSPGCILSRVRSRVVTLIAELAYSIYLTHLIAFYVARVLLNGSGLGKYDSVTFMVTMVAVLGASLTLFTMVERPFLLLRDHRFAYQTPTGSD
jgi:peptidoglycan/LPS O-acetylase OafA/YrhL